MSTEMQALYAERLGRYQAAIALEPTDRVPIAPGSNYFSETYSGCTTQEIIYDPDRWLQADMAFARAFPEVDVLRNNRLWGPLFDAVGSRMYRLPGRDLPPRVQFQFVEQEYMRADEYGALIENPGLFMMERLLPRALGDVESGGSVRANVAFLKGGMAYMLFQGIMRNRSVKLQEEMGLPQPMSSSVLAPFDYLADGLRGLSGVMLDIYRQPDNVLAACEAIIPDVVNAALGAADPLRRYPIFIPTHKAPFLSPKQFDTFYWPSLKKVMLLLIDAGYKIRIYLEGDWGAYWHHMLELPKGHVLCDIDNQGDIFQAKKDIGHHQCLSGGVPDSMLILGTPEQIRERVQLLCETVGVDGGFIVGGGCNIPYDTKPENFRAMIDAILEYGRYDENIRPKPRTAPTESKAGPAQRMFTPWDVKLAELGGVLGDEQLIKGPWEMLETMAYNWCWLWAL